MTAPVAPAPLAPRVWGWGRLVLALLLILFVPAMGPFRFFAPVEQALLLFIPAMAAMMVVGWRRGGSLVQAIAWTVLAGWTVLRSDSGALGAAPAFVSLATGWGLLLAASFGGLALVAPQEERPFLPRALIAIAVAGVVAALTMLVLGPSPATVDGTLLAEYSRRADEIASQLRLFVSAMQRQPGAEQNAEAVALFGQMADQVGTWPAMVKVLTVGLLGLESLVVLAVVWALYHRLARIAVGPPLAALKDFRFPDALVWGVILGLVTVLVPALADLRGVGANLLVFFGALYALRGVGVLWYFLAPGPVLSVVAVMLAVFAGPVAGAFAFGLGLGDTWIDWRRRAARPTP